MPKDDNQAFESAKASIEVEGFEVSNEQEELVKLKISGDITHEEFIKRAIEIANKK